VRDVKATVTGIIFVIPRFGIPVYIVTVKHAAVSHFTIASYTESVTFDMIHNTVSSADLRDSINGITA
jgi:hypothetical protein